MIRLAWFVAGAIVSQLLRRRDDLEDRLGELEAEADERRAEADTEPQICFACQDRMREARREGKLGIVTCGRDGCGVVTGSRAPVTSRNPAKGR